MGQKVNPHGLRVGVIKDWDSRWFTSKREFGDTLVEDYKIRKVLKKQLYNAGVPKIEIERTIDNATSKPRIRVTIHCAKPGMVIGRQGAEKEKIQAQLSKMTGKDVVNIVEVNNMSTNAAFGRGHCVPASAASLSPRHEMAMRNAMSPAAPARLPRRASRSRSAAV
ncbi:MAG: 30S ribosomal protein S3 [Ruthenibacterium sp.]